MGWAVILKMVIMFLQLLLGLLGKAQNKGELSEPNQERLSHVAQMCQEVVGHTTRLGIAPASPPPMTHEPD